MATPTLVVHIGAEGEVDYLAFGSAEARFLVVDERAPHDRVYRITRRHPPALLTALLGDSPIGDRDDGRHAALIGVVEAAIAGEPHLKLVTD